MSREKPILKFLNDHGLTGARRDDEPMSPPDSRRNRVDWDRIRSAFRPSRGLDIDESREVKLLNPQHVHQLMGDFSNVIGNEPNLLETNCSSAGWDTCAWHQSMHHFGSDWGIFVRQDCIIEHARDIGRFLVRGTAATPALIERLLLAGFYSLYLHEEFHHRVESMGIRLEVASRKPIYCPYKDRVYRPTLGSDDNLEEALANANIFYRLSHSPYRQVLGRDVFQATRAYLWWRFQFDPPGYRRARDYVYGDRFDEGRSQLAAQIQEADLRPKQDASPWNIVRDMNTGLFRISDRVWEVVSAPGKPPLFP